MSDRPSRRRSTPVPGVFGPDEAEPTDAAPGSAPSRPPEASGAAPATSPPTPAAPGPDVAPAAAAWIDDEPLAPEATSGPTPSLEKGARQRPDGGDQPRPVPGSPTRPLADPPPRATAPRDATRTPPPEAVTPEAGTPEAARPAAAPEAPLGTPIDAHVVSETVRLTEAEVVEKAKEATKERAKDVANLLVTYGKAHLPEREVKSKAEPTGPPKLKGRLGQILPILQTFPYILAGVFALSFWWDFDGYSVVIPMLDARIPLDGLLRVLSISGLIGFGTNWLAITMLFQPREKRAIIPQGLIPAQRERVIYRLSEAISKELINADIIKQKIQESGAIPRYRDMALGVVRGVVEDPGFRGDLRGIASGYVHDVLQRPDLRRELTRLAAEKLEEGAGQGLGGAVLKLYRSVAEDDFQRRIDKALDEIPGAVEPLLDRIDHALDAIPPKIEERSDDIEALATNAVLGFVESLDIRTMIVEKARGFDEGQLESLLKSTSNEQLNYIKYLGAILGVFGGLVIWQAGALLVFVAIALLIWLADEMLVRTRRRRAA